MPEKLSFAICAVGMVGDRNASGAYQYIYHFFSFNLHSTTACGRIKKRNHLRHLIAASLLLSVVIGFVGSSIPRWWHSTSHLGAGRIFHDHRFIAVGLQTFPAPATTYGGRVCRDYRFPGACVWISRHQRCGHGAVCAVIAVFVPALVLISFYALSPWFIRV